MFPTYLFMIGSYWVFLSGIVYIAGALTAKLFITGPSGADACVHPEKQRAYGKTAVPVILMIAIFTLTANLTHMVLHCSVMTETPLTQVWKILPLFLLKTRYGTYSLIRTFILVVIVLIISFSSKKHKNGIWVTGYVCSIVLLITLAMSGHQGSKGNLSFPLILDIFHILAISLWIGGLFFIYSNYSCFCKKAEKDRWDIFLDLINRISLMATVCVAVIVLTGLALYFYSFQSLSAVFSTQYGSVLLLKTGLAVILMMIGGVNKFLLLPGLTRTESTDWHNLCSFRNKLFTTMTLEVYIGLAVLLVTSLLTHLSPDM